MVFSTGEDFQTIPTTSSKVNEIGGTTSIFSRRISAAKSPAALKFASRPRIFFCITGFGLSRIEPENPSILNCVEQLLEDHLSTWLTTMVRIGEEAPKTWGCGTPSKWPFFGL